MDSESESKPESGPGGIPLKASKPGGASIRMTRSRESEPDNPTPLEKMADEEKKPEEIPNSEDSAKPKLPPKQPPAVPPEKPAPEPGTPAPQEEASEKEADGSSGEASKPKAPKLPPKTGLKPKLTPKIPVKPAPSSAEKTSSTDSSQANPSETSQPPRSAKPSPPKPHVVRPGAATAKSHPTQGGASVPMASSKPRVVQASPVGVVIDVVTGLGALAVVYLVLKDLLLIL